jgi:hypothetical protein
MWAPCLNVTAGATAALGFDLLATLKCRAVKVRVPPVAVEAERRVRPLVIVVV